MRRIRPHPVALWVAGLLTACQQPGGVGTRFDPPQGGNDIEPIGEAFPFELDDPFAAATPSYRGKIVPKQAVDQAKKPYLQYCPFIEFEVNDAFYSPRWPGASVAYRPGLNPLPPGQRDLFRLAVDRLNRAAGVKVFAVLPDNASADIPVTDSRDFPAPSVLGETTAKVVARVSEESIAIDYRLEVRLRQGLSNSLFFKVALHELGHAAGLDHNPDADALMNEGTTFRTPDDFARSEKESLKLLYSLPDAPPSPARRTQSVGSVPVVGWNLN